MFHRNTPADRRHLKILKRASFRRKLAHPKTQKHMVGLTLGTGLMVLGAGLSLHSEAIAHIVPPLVLEPAAWFIHGCGCCPFMTHIEPLWHIFQAEAENVV